MYNEKLKPILEDIENKELEIAGGSCVGMILGITNSLIMYICNLTIGKKNYDNVQNEVIKIKNDAGDLKNSVLKIIDNDKEILEEILKAYKSRKENPEHFETISKKAVEYCMDVTNKSLDILKLAYRISKVGNKMLSSDFEICKLYAFASVEASIINVNINLKSVKDEDYKIKIQEKVISIYNEANNIKGL